MNRQTVMEGGANEAAADADDVHVSNSDSDSDVDASTHDFTADGVLPEAITSLHVVRKPHERAAQLAADQAQRKQCSSSPHKIQTGSR